MDGSSWETRVMLPQWSNDPWSILNPIADEGFMDSGHAGLHSRTSSHPQNNVMIDGSGSGSRSGSLDCLLSGSSSKTDPGSSEDDGISLFFSDDCCQKRRSDNGDPSRFGVSKRIRKSSDSGVNISFRQGNGSEPDPEAIQQMKEMIYRAAAFRPVNLGADEVGEKPKRRNVRISSDPQTVAARQRRERISDRLRVLQKLVPGGCKMDTASMLDEAANYLKFLRNQVKALEAFAGGNTSTTTNHLNTATGNYLVCPPVNLQFSSLPFLPMQDSTSLAFSIQNPNPLHLPKC